MINKLYVSKNCYKTYVDFEYEILLETNEMLLQSTQAIIKTNVINIKKGNLYQDLKFHQDSIKNFYYFNDFEFFKHYLTWRYRVYHFRNIDTDYLLHEHKVWQEIGRKFIHTQCINTFNTIYEWMIQNHMELKDDAINFQLPPLNVIENKIFNLALISDFDELVKHSAPYCNTLEDFCTFFSKTITNIMHFVGYKWEINELSIAKEHLITSSIEKIAFHFLNTFIDKPKNNKTILISGVAGEYHSLGLKLAVLIVEKLGYTAINFGTHTPKEHIVASCIEFNPALILLSSSLFSNIEEVDQIINELKIIDVVKGKIGISGGAFLSLQSPLATINSDYYIKDFTELFSLIND